MPPAPPAKPKPLSAPQKALHKLGLDRPIDLALHLPLRYEDETRFDCAYTTIRAVADIGLHLKGFRTSTSKPGHHQTAIQCLEHTLGYAPIQWQLFAQAHTKRNLAEYEGDLDVSDGFISELIAHAADLIAAARALSGPS